MTTRTFTFTVTAPVGPPPAGANQYTLVGTNNLQSLFTANSGAGQRFAGWTYAKFIEALTDSYGSGIFVPAYGSSGSWVAQGLSGDAASQIYDGIVFDFADYTWRVDTNLGGVGDSVGPVNNPVKHPITDSSGSPYYELLGFNQVPHSGQPYRLKVAVGTKIVRTMGSAMGYPPTPTWWSHYYDCATKKCGRYSTNTLPYTENTTIEGTALYDETANRIVYVTKEMLYVNRLPYLDLADQTWKSSASFTAPNGGQESSNWPHYLLHDDGTRRCLLAFKAQHLVSGVLTSNYATVLNLSNVAAGWTSVNLAGSTTHLYSGGRYVTRWAQYPAVHGGDDCHYAVDGDSGTITKIAPPATGITGTWQMSQITPSTGTLPLNYHGSGTNPHHTRFFFVPALQCFAWIPGGAQQVALWRP